MDVESRRGTLAQLLLAGVAAAAPEPLTRAALVGEQLDSPTLIAIGKAAVGMCRGAAEVLGAVAGICVSQAPGELPDGVESIIGDHPVPGCRSFAAGEKVLETAAGSAGPIVALISGGGSSLCEHPIDGVSRDFITEANRRLLHSGASIAETNLVRRHLSAIKNGGLAALAPGAIYTYAISDVCGADPAIIASGPTLYRPLEPDVAIAAMSRYGIEVNDDVRTAISKNRERVSPGPLTVIGDGHTATRGLAAAASDLGMKVEVCPDWIQGDVGEVIHGFIGAAKPGLTVGTGEADVPVTGDGVGGRNTHAALLAATAIAGTDALFAALATDGADGSSSSAGAIVDGGTIGRGGDPRRALESSDSATYLDETGDLIETGPTGTNVSDLWVLWK